LGNEIGKTQDRGHGDKSGTRHAPPVEIGKTAILPDRYYRTTRSARFAAYPSHAMPSREHPLPKGGTRLHAQQPGWSNVRVNVLNVCMARHSRQFWWF
jgi:hypothetical protein